MKENFSERKTRDFNLTNEELLNKFDEMKQITMGSIKIGSSINDIKNQIEFESKISSLLKDLDTDGNRAVITAMFFAYTQGFVEGSAVAGILSGDKK